MMSKPYVYAETAFHHEGDVPYLRRLVDEAAEAGAGGIKFQVLLDPLALFSPLHPALESLKGWVLSEDAWVGVAGYAVSRGLELVWMPLDVGAVRLAQRFASNIRFLEIHSVSFYDQELLEAILASDCAVGVGVGGRTLAEIESLRSILGSRLTALVVGFQAFPTALEDVRLQRIADLRARFPEVQIGYADHSDPAHESAVVSNEYAYLLGATLFEKHLALPGTHHQTDLDSAVFPDCLKEIVARLKSLHGMLTEFESWEFPEKERIYRHRQKVWVAAVDLPQGATLKAGDLVLRMMPGSDGLGGEVQLWGRTLRSPVLRGAIVSSGVLLD